ncbi:MAG: sulfite exporter TauE/SafE family protein [Oscillospiraceae bacterium]|nr:sulfite exporter TauE/SafE family protein [Oscillospiraceae bacterium]
MKFIRSKTFLGILTGLLNGLFGSGGGMVAVPMLRGQGMKEEEAHATSISLILPLAVISGFLYRTSKAFTLTDALPYLPGGLLGAVFGAWLLPKISGLWLRRIFGAVILFSAGRLLLR